MQIGLLNCISVETRSIEIRLINSVQKCNYFYLTDKHAGGEQTEADQMTEKTNENLNLTIVFIF